MANFHLIKTFAKQKEMTLAELAEAIGITPAGLTLIIKSGSTNTTTIENIARKLGVPVGAFFDDNNPESVEETASDLLAVIKQKDEIIAQKDKIIEQKDAIINILTKNQPS
jgi:transcriptional regulator with XRE-family HTH domain